MICPECGHELDSNNICHNPNCITNIKKENEDVQFRPNTENLNTNDNYNFQNLNSEFRDSNDISPVEMIEFIGDNNTEYYIDKWTRFQDNSNFISWNWPAFLFGFFWFWFRKMYNIAGILFAIGIANAVLLSGFGWLRSIVSLTITIGCGLLANQLYIKHATSKIKSSKLAIGFDNNMLLRRLRSIGGRTWVPLIVAIVLGLIFTTLFVIGLMALHSTFGDFKYLR
ncbi:DUF2628 domain-containing protein [Clostridium sp. SHJSY1]|uniref:DUF2628 domain-containing protein n=1 Tax=Clostridium sp. SHJSY1 TaxID=2942483 RepID=UPI0028748BA3|nr:DUF2628 domain-containing protein [Clostridium sp. SHJSY1]MDS0526966.1 DUF2628 domain-containing protein [Clostridium sp. SHJSY1]